MSSAQSGRRHLHILLTTLSILFYILPLCDASLHCVDHPTSRHSVNSIGTATAGLKLVRWACMVSVPAHSSLFSRMRCPCLLRFAAR